MTVKSAEMSMADMMRESGKSRRAIQHYLAHGLPHHRIEVGGSLHIRVTRVDFEAWLTTVKQVGRPRKGAK